MAIEPRAGFCGSRGTSTVAHWNPFGPECPSQLTHRTGLTVGPEVDDPELDDPEVEDAGLVDEPGAVDDDEAVEDPAAVGDDD